MPAPISTTDSDYSLSETADRVRSWSEVKTRRSLERRIVLALMAGVLIGLGAAVFTAILTESSLGAGPTRLVGGLGFSIGLLLIVATGAELSTGNLLMAGPAAMGQIPIAAARRAIVVSFLANVVGAFAIALMVAGSGILHGGIGLTSAKIAEAKMALGTTEAILRGALCNALVALAIWMVLSARTVAGRMVGVLAPISAFVVLGFEHSIANVYLLTTGLMAGAEGSLAQAALSLAAVAVGNLIGGLVVALWLGYAHGLAAAMPEPARVNALPATAPLADRARPPAIVQARVSAGEVVAIRPPSVPPAQRSSAEPAEARSGRLEALPIPTGLRHAGSPGGLEATGVRGLVVHVRQTGGRYVIHQESADTLPPTARH